MYQPAFSSADLLIPHGADLPLWCVVACDQYTSEPAYWTQLAQQIGSAPSALKMIFPEVYLEQPSVSGRIAAINQEMETQLAAGFFREYAQSYVYIERTLPSGKVRHGLIGKLDLEQYTYIAGSQSPIRPTEGTVESRLPPRVQVRENAPMELPHTMVLINDITQSVIEPLAQITGHTPPLYDFDLLGEGGHLRGWLVDAAAALELERAISLLHGAQTGENSPLLFAVGDGNHSLATAKVCFERLKKTMPESQWRVHPGRYALAELVNIHDPGLEFEPIHRILFDVNPAHVMEKLSKFYKLCEFNPGRQSFICLLGEEERVITLENPGNQLEAGSVQQFTDQYLEFYGGRVDYIHGDDVVRMLARQENTVGFLLPVLGKDQLFQTVMLDGVLPRKTFSMGHAHEKRFYLEARRIR